MSMCIEQNLHTMPKTSGAKLKLSLASLKKGMTWTQYMIYNIHLDKVMMFEHLKLCICLIMLKGMQLPKL